MRRSTTTSSAAPCTQVTNFAWLGGSSAKWMPRSVPALRHRAVRLGELEAVPGGLRERVLAEPLEEDASVVAVLGRGDLEGPGDRELADQHACRLAEWLRSRGVTWLVTGAHGMLGTDVCTTLAQHEIEHTAVGEATST